MLVSISRIPANATASATKVGSYWTSGSINFYRRGNVVQVLGSPALTAVNNRQVIATIPAGFRPIDGAYAIVNGYTDGSYFIFLSNGNIQNGQAAQAGSYYFSATWLTNG